MPVCPEFLPIIEKQNVYNSMKKETAQLANVDT
jgi:hypothetical protein